MGLHMALSFNSSHQCEMRKASEHYFSDLDHYLSLKLKQYALFMVCTRYLASFRSPSSMVWLFREPWLRITGTLCWSLEQPHTRMVTFVCNASVTHRVSPLSIRIGMSTWPLLVTCSTQSLTDKVGLVLILHQPSMPTIQELHQPPPRSHFAQQPAAGGFELRNLALRLIWMRSTISEPVTRPFYHS